MLTMSNRKLFTFINICVTRNMMLNFEIEDSIVIWKAEGFGVNGFGGGGGDDGESCADVWVEHVDV